MCKSQWGYCGIGPEYCGKGFQSGSCTPTGNNNKTNIINQTNFQCAFYNLNVGTRVQRYNGLNQSGWKPFNADEAAYCALGKFHQIE